MARSLVVLRAAPAPVRTAVRRWPFRALAYVASLGLASRLFARPVEWLISALLRRLPFVAYLAGQDVAGFARRLRAEIVRKRGRGHLSRRYLRGWLAALLTQAWAGPRRRRRALLRTGTESAAFAILSPSSACNLRCSHCYANAEQAPRATRSFAQVLHTVRALSERGTSLIVISGGEPLIFRDRHLGLFELVAAFPDLLFVVYTNGTLLDQECARRFAELGNVLPLLSVEGLEANTDKVRGAGVYSSVTAAMAQLRAAGVLFGVSATASSLNADELGSAEFYRRLMDGEGASFGWLLELAAQGRGGQSLVLSAVQRQRLQQAINWQVELGRLLVSFLHTPLSQSGCFGAQRFDGFFYLDWEGHVSRCVYQPQIRIDAGDRTDNSQTARELIDECAQLPACSWATQTTSDGPTEELGL